MADITYQPNSLIDLDMSKVGQAAPPDDMIGAMQSGELNLDRPIASGMKYGFQELGKGRFWKAAFTFGYGDYIDEMSGQERIRRTNELKRMEADRLAEEQLARSRKRNLAAGLALMQNANMVNFFR